MKILKFFTLFLLLFISSQVAIASDGFKPEKEVIRDQITEILQEEFKNDQITNEEPIKIVFMITNANEIIVLKTNADIPVLDQRIKSALNYNQLNADKIKSGTYNMDIVFQAENNRDSAS